MYQEIIKEFDLIVYLYNDDKPHIKLKRKTPMSSL
jgi:hypothetical protein